MADEMSLLEAARAKAAEAVRRSNEGASREPVERFYIMVAGEYELTLTEAKHLAQRVSELAGHKAILRRL